MSQIIKNSTGGGGSGIITISGDSGSITGSNVTIFTNNALKNSGASVAFINSGTTSTFQLSDIRGNTYLGEDAGDLLSLTTGGNSNTSVGKLTLSSVSENANFNAALGSSSLASIIDGDENSAFGASSGEVLTNGNNNCFFGWQSGSSYTSTESNNIIIGSNVSGVIGDSGVIRIGDSTSLSPQTSCYISGIEGVTVAASSPVGIESNGQLSDLGFGTSGEALVSNGAGNSPTWQNVFSGSVQTTSTSSNPVDSVTYYLCTGQALTFTQISTNTVARFYAAKACTINTVYGAFRVGGTLGTTESGTLFIRKNDTSNTNISTAVDLSTTEFAFNATGLGVSLAAGDYITFGFTTPAWATNPTLVGCALSFST